MGPLVSRRHLRRVIDKQTGLILELRRTIQAQASALIVLTDAAEEHVATAREWRQLALNTADFNAANAIESGE